MVRTTRVVQRAASSWSQIFSHDISFEPKSDNCSDLQKEVKKFLRSCPSSVESEIMAFQSIKKLLPSSCKCMEADLLHSLEKTLSSPPRSLPRGYIAFVRKRVRSLFRKGWDSGLYQEYCYVNTPGLSGTVDSSRLAGGCMGAVQDQVELLDRTLGLSSYDVSVCDAQLIVVQSAGKPRPLTKFRSSDLCLRPLHKSLYEHLSRTTRWLCRGDPTAEKLARAGFVEGGGLLVSGDYRSATDNLSLEVAEVILECILENSVSVPISVKNHARAILRPLLWNVEHGIEFEVSRGQMMGSYLSFPLLCIQNFLSFDYSRELFGIDKCPLLINGDDILFQSPTVDFPQQWISLVGDLGLEVEESKTSVSGKFGTLNSTLFEWEEGVLRVVPTLRFGMLRQSDYVNSLGASFHSFVRGQPPAILWKAARTFFSWHLPELKGVRFRPDELGFRGALAFRLSRIFGLLDRDLTILTLPAAPVPHNVVLSSDRFVMVPEGALSAELRLSNDRQMASWKFSLDYEECRVRAALRYCLQLSMARRPITDFHVPSRILLTDDFSWRRLRRRRFFRPLYEGLRLVPILDDVLLSQCTRHWENPPTYEESEGVFEEAVGPSKEKVKTSFSPVLRRRLPDITW
jgi:hypothetical protein